MLINPSDIKTSDRRRFWAKVRRGSAAECWEWTAGLATTGYGYFGFGGRRGGAVYASRFAWVLHNGAIPEGVWVLHRCDNRKCCNPAHLFLGTRHDNIADAQAKGRIPKGNDHWSRRDPSKVQRGDGHYSRRRPDLVRRGEKQPNAKISEADAIAIKADSRLHREIAASYGLSRPTVSMIKSGRLWKHLP